MTAERRRGEPWALGQVFGYAIANVLDRFALAHADPLILPLLRGLPSLLLGIVLVWKYHTLAQLRPGSPQYMSRRAILPFLWAGLISTVGLFAYAFAIRVGGVVITIPALETYVIWGPLIAWFALKERLRPVALVGIGLIVLGLGALSWGQFRGQPITPYWYWAVPLAIFAAVTYGLAGVLWRDGQLRGAHQSTAILLQFLASIAVAIVGLGLFGRWSLLQQAAKFDLLALLASGVSSGIIGIYCMFTALRLMSVARVTAFSALTPLLAALLAHLFLGEYLSLMMLVGVLLVSVGVVLTQVFRSPEERQA
jgi:drug/metabolite transporter (DMT)-like permease